MRQSMLNLELWNESSFHMSTLNLPRRKGSSFRFLDIFQWKPTKVWLQVSHLEVILSSSMINVLFLPKMLWFNTNALAMNSSTCSFFCIIWLTEQFAQRWNVAEMLFFPRCFCSNTFSLLIIRNVSSLSQIPINEIKRNAFMCCVTFATDRNDFSQRLNQLIFYYT